MAKKDIVEVNLDEDEIRRMIAGNIHPSSLLPNAGSKIESPPDKDIEVKEKDNKDINSETKKTRVKIKGNYKELFLSVMKFPQKKKLTTYISEENYRNIIDTLRITDDISINMYINNILSHHFEKYKNDIMDVQKQIINNILKK